MMNNDKRNYFLSVFISSPQPEHVEIKDIIQNISGGNFQIAHLHQTCIAFVFSSHLMPRQIETRLEGAVFNDDRRLLIELGRGWMTFGLDKAATWLNRNLGSPR